jgi:hypothetical protein
MPVPGAPLVLGVAGAVLAVPRRLDRVLRGVESLAALPDLVERVEALGDLTEHASQLAELTRHAAALEELTHHASALHDLTRHAASLEELNRHASALPALTEHAAVLPDLVTRVERVETMVLDVLRDLADLRPTVDALTLAAGDLGRAVDPLGRIAGRLPGGRARGAGRPALEG